MSETQAPAVPALVLRRTFDASRERVFEAWTKPELLRQFLAPGNHSVAEIQVDLRPGGRYRVVMQKADGERIAVGGTYRELREPSLIVMTWQWEEDDPALEVDTLLTLEFHDRGKQTELVLTHENFGDLGSRGRHEYGWNGSFEKLETLLGG